MLVEKNDVIAVLREFNPWWDKGQLTDIPSWNRAAFSELMTWTTEPPSARATLLSGARRVGKTTLFRQAIHQLLENEIPPQNIFYATLDHPLFKLTGLESLLQIWHELFPNLKGTEYLFLDEIQNIPDWQTWVKHQIDFQKNSRIALTGSAIPLFTKGTESGTGRLHTIKLPTLSFYEYLKILKISSPDLPKLSSLAEVQKQSNLDWIAEMGKSLLGHFHEYLQRGGFPETAQIDDVRIAQKLLREDIIDRVLKRDMTDVFGIRNVAELERIFLYLCYHDGGMLNISQLSKTLGLSNKTVSNYIDVLEAASLIYRLRPYGYGKRVLKGHSKIYLADPAIFGSLFLKGKGILENATKLGAAVESAFFKHVFTRYYQESIGFTYWRGNTGKEVDIIAEACGELIAFEVKYRASKSKPKDLAGLKELAEKYNVDRAYVITGSAHDFGPLQLSDTLTVQRIPAWLACYWLSQSEGK